MLSEGSTEKEFYISKQKEKITIDEDTIMIIDIIDEIVQNEESLWLKKIFSDIKSGKKDVAIISQSPMERTKYYEIKKEFVNKIYICCVYKGLVSYEDILRSKLG